MALIWPWAVVDPLNPLRAVDYFSHFFEKPWQEMFAGVLISRPTCRAAMCRRCWRSRCRRFCCCSGSAGVFGAVSSLARRRAPPHAPRHTSGRGARGASRRSPDGDPAGDVQRHPAFRVPGAAVRRRSADSPARGSPRSRASCAVAPTGDGRVPLSSPPRSLPMIEMVRLHPYEYTHFNQIAGGVRGAPTRYMLDYWGLSFKQASRGAARQDGRARRETAGRREMDDRGLRPASARRRWSSGQFGHLGPQGRRFRDDARRVLLRKLNAPIWSRSSATALYSRASTTSAAARSRRCSPSRR